MSRYSSALTVPGRSTNAIALRFVFAAMLLGLAAAATAQAQTATASYVGVDTTTSGNWTGKYGPDGFQIATDSYNALPSYATLSMSGQGTFIWGGNSSDPRALQIFSGSPSGLGLESIYYSTGSSLSMNLNLTDGNAHQIALYLLDLDANRAETITVSDAATNAVLDTRSYSNFSGGEYASWTVKGHVIITVTSTAGQNAVVSGIFFGTGATTSATSSASYAGLDTNTLGSWSNTYGGDGFQIANDSLFNSLPSYATVNITGASTFTWSGNSTDHRALQPTRNESPSLASTYYSTGPSLSIDLNLTDGAVHPVSLYLLDWDGGRAETIVIKDAATNAVLSAQSFSNFGGGDYANWNLKGHVIITITYTAGQNAIFSGIFFGRNGAVANVSPTSLNFSSAVGVTSAPQTVKVTNTGSSPLAIDQISSSFAITNNCGPTVAPGSSCTVSVTFTPSVVGTTTGTLTILDNSVSGPSQTVSLTGTATATFPVPVLQPTSLNFGSLPVGTASSVQTVQIGNTGSVPLNISSIAVSGTGFAISSNSCGTSLAAVQQISGTTCVVGVTFTPSTVGPASGTLTFTDNASGGSQTVPLTGTGVATTSAATASFSQTSISETAIANTTSSSPQGVNLSNTGSAPLLISNVALTGAGFSVVGNNCGTSLAPGTLCSVGVLFTPTAVGTVNGALTFTDNSSTGSTQTIALTGTSLSPSPVASVGPASLTFTSPVGTISAQQTVRLINSGNYAPLVISNVTVSGPGFAIIPSSTPAANSCTVVEVPVAGSGGPANTECDVIVAFTPTATGTVTGALTFTDNSSTGSTQTVSLTGTGTSGASNSASYVGLDTKTLGTWTGVYGGDGYSIAGSAVADTTYTKLPAYASLNINGAGTFIWGGNSSDPRALQTFTGSPAGLGIESIYYATGSTFNLDVNLTDGNSHLVALYLLDLDGGRAETITITDASTHSVLDTQSYNNFGAGEYAVWNLKGHVIITIANTAGQNAVFSGIFFGKGATTSPNASANYVGTDTTTLGNYTTKYGFDGSELPLGTPSLPAYATTTIAGASGYVWEYQSADPRALRPLGATLGVASTFYSNSSLGNSLTIDVNLTDGNTHEVSLYLLDWDGGRAETAVITDPLTNAVLSVQSFSNFGGGEYATWMLKGHVLITITKTAGQNAIFNAIFFGGGQTSPLADLVLSATSLTFNPTLVGASSTQNVILYNVGTAPMTISNIAVTGSGEYTADSSMCPNPLPAGSSCTLVVTFVPNAVGPAGGLITLTDNAKTTTQTISLNGAGVASQSAPTASLSNTSLVFSALPGLNTNAQVVSLTNTGSAGLTISSVVLSGNWFSLAGNTCGTLLPAGATCQVGIVFNPPAVGTVTGSLTFTDNSSTGTTQTVALTGTGLSPAPIAVLSPTSLTFTSPLGVTSSVQYVNLGNSGYTALTISNIAVNGSGFAINSQNSPSPCSNNGSVPAGQPINKPSNACQVGITFTPSTTGTVTGTLTFTDNSSTGTTQTVTLTGTGTSGGTALASYVGLDTTTLGAWTGKYGADGYSIAGTAVADTTYTKLPQYASLNINRAGTFIWAGNSSDPRALQTFTGSPSGLGLESIYYSTASSFSMDVNFTDGNTHLLAVYLLDLDGGRAETITITDAVTNAVLDTRSYSNFGTGEYAVWNLTGHVLITVTSTAGQNAVVSGIFFGKGATTSPNASASFTGLDTTTQGTWLGKYGAGGFQIANGAPQLPTYATMNIGGALPYLWVAESTDPRALQTGDGTTDRAASTFYSSPGNTLTIDLNLSDGNTHSVSLYLLDWDGGRAETAVITDPTTNAVLSVQSFSNFGGGEYATWTLKGHVLITVTKTAGQNAIFSGIFFNN